MVKVNREKCIGCGTCQAICPEVFEIDDNSKAKIISQAKSSCIKEAIEACPIDAIS